MDIDYLFLSEIGLRMYVTANIAEIATKMILRTFSSKQSSRAFILMVNTPQTNNDYLAATPHEGSTSFF